MHQINSCFHHNCQVLILNNLLTFEYPHFWLSISGTEFDSNFLDVNYLYRPGKINIMLYQYVDHAIARALYLSLVCQIE